MKDSNRYLIFFRVLFIVFFFTACIIPVGLIKLSKGSVSENRTLSSFPLVRTDEGSLNREFFSQFDTYINEHFFLRGSLINTHGKLLYNLFKSSGDSQVIPGKGDWLFFGSTMEDFVGITLPSEKIDFIAYSLEGACSYIENLGMKPLIMIVPNKNSVYPEYMPKIYGNKADRDNLTLLQNKLAERNIPYIDVKEILVSGKAGHELYHHTDTHWNNTGARLVLNSLYKTLGVDYDYPLEGYTVEDVHKSDLYGILYPASDKLSPDRTYENPLDYFKYRGKVRSMDDFDITTINPESRNGRIMVFRDSFGRAIIPYMGEAFESCSFNRSTPYDLTMLDGTDYNYVVIEIVERNIHLLEDIKY